jgi:UDP-N-acetyl-D-glucosamine dehydrogenase
VPSLAHEGLSVAHVELTPEIVCASDAVVILTDHREFDYPMVVQLAGLIVDARNATRGLTAPDNRIIRL